MTSIASQKRRRTRQLDLMQTRVARGAPDIWAQREMLHRRIKLGGQEIDSVLLSEGDVSHQQNQHSHVSFRLKSTARCSAG